MSRGSLLLLQAGGPTTVLNASLAAAIAEARAAGAYDAIYGSRLGFEGLVQGDWCDLGALSESDLYLLSISPGAALGSSRFKPGPDDFQRLLPLLERHNVRSLLFLGGNGTMRGAAATDSYLQAAGFDARLICAPKTIDNDIMATDRSPGFGSAARYFAQSVRDLGMDVRSLSQPVSIVETLGRSVGWLAGASALGKQDEADAPHLVYVPERPLVMERFLADLEGALRRHGWAVVVVAEGLRDATGEPVYQNRGNARTDAQMRPLIGGVAEHLAGVASEALGVRCRSEKPGLLGRSCGALVSPQDRADAVMAGRAGVRALLAGASGKAISILPLRDAPEGDTRLVPLEQAAAGERVIPAEFLTDGPIAVNAAFLRYAAPLAGELAPYFSSERLVPVAARSAEIGAEQKVQRG